MQLGSQTNNTLLALLKESLQFQKVYILKMINTIEVKYMLLENEINRCVTKNSKNYYNRFRQGESLNMFDKLKICSGLSPIT